MNEKRWKTKSGVVVVERGRYQTTDRRGRLAWKVHAYRESGGFHGKLWLKNLRSIEPMRRPKKRVTKPTPRAIRWALKVLWNAFEPRDVPYLELRSLQTFLEAQLPEEP